LRDGMSIADALPQILDLFPSAVVVFDASGALRFLNRRAHGVFVIDERAPLGSQDASRVLGELHDELYPLLSVVRTRQQLEVRTVRTMSGDEPRWADVHVLPFVDDTVLVGVTDVTARERRRLALERNEREMSALLELLPSSVRVIDLAGRLEQVSDVTYAEHAEPRPQSLRDLWSRDMPRDMTSGRAVSYLDCPGVRALSGEIVRGQLLEVRRLGQDGTRTVESWATPLRASDGRVSGALLLDRDISDRVHAEASMEAKRNEIDQLRLQVARDADRLDQLVEERARERVELEEVRSRDRRLAAVGQLAAGVMHDVNNSLNPIMAAAFLLRHHAESPDAVRDYADRISKAAETAAATASRVGRFIRQEPVHAGGDEAVDLTVLANEVLDLTEPMRLRRSSGAAVRAERLLRETVRTRGLPGEIREALLSLVQNAMDAMALGGTLTVRSFVDGADACIAVQDNGVGMSEEVRERAFEPFFSTKGAGGSGLGLAEVYGIARRHRGTATIESTTGYGTTVTLRLPLDTSPIVPAPLVVLPPTPSEPQRLLVVEDHEDGRHFLQRMLESNGHTVDAVGSCAEARERLAAIGASPYHLMLTDVGLPDGSGWDLVAFAKAHMPSMRVGVITGWEPIVSADDAVGVEFVLRKPLRAEELLAHIAGPPTPTSTE